MVACGRLVARAAKGRVADVSTRLKQTGLVALGIVLALAMGFMGLWQMQVFVEKGNRTIEARTELPPVPLFEHVRPDGSTDDIYGKPVTIEGHYLAEELLIPTEEGRVRVLTAFATTEGRVVPVVRGVTERANVTPPPTGRLTQTGLFLPGEGDVAAPEGTLGSVRMPLLAQHWPDYRLTPGFVTLCETDAGAQGLAQASVDLPQGKGSFQNGGYALQWWVFGAFALLMSLKLAQMLGRKDRLAQEEAARAELGK